MKKILLNLMLVILVLIPINTLASNKNITLHLFTFDSCPHCHDEIEFIETYLNNKDNIHFKKYSITNNQENKDLFIKVQNYLNKQSTSVPYLVIGNTNIIGFSGQNTENNIKETINYYLNNDYCDVVSYINGESNISCSLTNEINERKQFDLPIIGKVYLGEVSLPLVAMIIGFVDGFNPCAMWILLFLITMLLGTKDRKKMWFLGITFLLVSAVTYLFFMKSWLNIANYINKISYIRIGIGLVGVVFGTINIKSFLTKQESGCEIIDDKKRNKIMQRIKNIIKEKSFILAFLGIIILAIAVNLIELFCSLGLPVMFTQILALNNLSPLTEWLYLIIYITFFLIDDLIIFAIAMFSLKVTGISTKYTKYSHLIGGIILFLIGILMLLKPGWLMFNF